MNTILKNSALSKKIIGLLLIIVIFSVVGFYFGTRKTSNPSQNIEKLAQPLAETNLNQNFEFPVKELKEEDAKLKLTLVSAKKVKAIAHQGEPIMAKSGEEYLIISVEYGNDTAYALKATSRDFVRLLGDEGKQYAPDLYNEAIDIPAKAVIKDEIGFIVQAGQKQFKLQVGQIGEAEGTTVEINF